MKRFDIEPVMYSQDMFERENGEYILYDDFVKALAMIYNSGMFGDEAIADILTFDSDESGALLGKVRDAALKLRKGE